MSNIMPSKDATHYLNILLIKKIKKESSKL